MAAAATQEIELKRLLLGDDGADRLLQALGPVVSDVEQVNHVFDTAGRGLRHSRHSIRLREASGRFVLTAKGPGRQVSGSVSARAEAEAEVDASVARNILAGHDDPTEVLRQRATDSAFDELWLGLDRARAGQPLLEVGQFRNRRRMVEAVAAGLAVRVEVDQTEFPDGHVDDEVEIELPDPESAVAVEGWLEQLAAAAGVETQPSSAKLARFYAALEGPAR